MRSMLGVMRTSLLAGAEAAAAASVAGGATPVLLIHVLWKPRGFLSFWGAVD